MWYVDQCKPLPIDIGSPINETATRYLFEGVGYFKIYCHATREEAIDAIIKYESNLCYCRNVWVLTGYGSLPRKIRVQWKGRTLMTSLGVPIKKEILFNTELEAIDHMIDNPDPIFLNRRKELIK